MNTVCDGAEAIGLMLTHLYRLTHQAVRALWPDVRRQITTILWASVHTVRLIFYALVIPPVLIVGILGVPIYVLECIIALTDLVLTKVQ